jgi:hypothetical protein
MKISPSEMRLGERGLYGPESFKFDLMADARPAGSRRGGRAAPAGGADAGFL